MQPRCITFFGSLVAFIISLLQDHSPLCMDACCKAAVSEPHKITDDPYLAGKEFNWQDDDQFAGSKSPKSPSFMTNPIEVLRSIKHRHDQPRTENDFEFPAFVDLQGTSGLPQPSSSCLCMLALSCKAKNRMIWPALMPVPQQVAACSIRLSL